MLDKAWFRPWVGRWYIVFGLGLLGKSGIRPELRVESSLVQAWRGAGSSDSWFRPGGGCR